MHNQQCQFSMELRACEEQFGPCESTGWKCDLSDCFQHISGQHTAIPDTFVCARLNV